MVTSDDMQRLRQRIYEGGDLLGIDRPLPADPIVTVGPGARANSIAVAGGAFGDEGKGRIADELCARFIRQGKRPLVYRWNGGANAGHTVIVEGRRVALHQLPSGALHPEAIVALGKGMVLHPGDLVTELESVLIPASPQPEIHIDQLAVLSLDTHRAFEAALRDWESGGKGATGRGISPAYADVLYRHPVRMRDLAAEDWEARLSRHYDLYAALISGLGHELRAMNVPSLASGTLRVGSKTEFLARLRAQREKLCPMIGDIYFLLRQHWDNPASAFVFEGAQAVGLDPRFGVYPDITASDPTFSGIAHSTEGLICPERIAVRAGAIKATYTSSVGTRRLPTLMDDRLAHRIREDAHEYGATTRRPRDIAYIDLPCLRYFAEVSGMTHLVLTHLDIAYPDTPIRVCTHYTDTGGEMVPYRPDQEYLDGVTPQYIDLPSWDGAAASHARAIGDLPFGAQQYIAFITGALNVEPLVGTTGPQREALITWIP